MFSSIEIIWKLGILLLSKNTAHPFFCLWFKSVVVSNMSALLTYYSEVIATSPVCLWYLPSFLITTSNERWKDDFEVQTLSENCCVHCLETWNRRFKGLILHKTFRTASTHTNNWCRNLPPETNHRMFIETGKGY